jgi:hypothetical protein
VEEQLLTNPILELQTTPPAEGEGEKPADEFPAKIDDLIKKEAAISIGPSISRRRNTTNQLQAMGVYRGKERIYV